MYNCIEKVTLEETNVLSAWTFQASNAAQMANALPAAAAPIRSVDTAPCV